MVINYSKSTQYLCAFILIITSIVLAFIQVLDIDTVETGTLMYIAQAFLLAGSIFGLDYYVKKLSSFNGKETNSPKRDKKQQSPEH